MSEGPKKADDKVNTFGIALIGVVSTFLVWASIVALQAYYGATGATMTHEREIEGQADEVRGLNAEQQAQLNPEKVETVDAQKGTVRVPIKVAMAQVVETLKANPGASAVPAIGAHDTATVPAVEGGSLGQPTEGAEPTDGAQPADGAEPTDGAQPEGAQPPTGEPAPAGAPH